ncbi:hypothetical protein BRAS3843_1540001 [Bradyrhizobium sp. STM 3843]|nr:hypothetical protein BRAS3843_1540001 [Bradyrhizobium sp. STM 3843]
MEWLRWHFEHNRAAIVVAMLIVAFLVAYLVFPPPFRSESGNGFGPDWECTIQPQSEPTCIKKLRR